MIVGAVTWQAIADGLGLGAIYALMAVGIGLVFGVLRLVNFAYGQLIMVGAYTLAATGQSLVNASVYAPAMISCPYAKFTSRRTPKTSPIPTAMSA